MDKRKLNNETGITIIALSITIIVMLILAGISIATVSPMIKNSEEAKQEQDIETEKSIVSRAAFAAEKVGVKGVITQANLQKMMQNELPSGNFTVTDNGNGFTITFTDSNRSYNVDATGNSVYGITIPDGYYYVGGTKESGLVISDNSADEKLDAGKEDVRRDLAGNQWVWVPVETPSSLYTTVTAGVALAGTTGVKTTKYTNSEIISGKTRVKPGNTSDFREPDILTDSFHGCDDTEDRAKTAGFSSLANMAETMVREYDEIIRSIEKYKGFYIGRYELTANGEKKGATQTDVNWYTLYANCKKWAKAGSKVKTRMIWGLQWDATCNWLENSGFSMTNSSTWGNYSNSTVDGHGSKQDTGFSESWKANNIYDFAGNCSEWTQEADNTRYRVHRGGVYYNNSSVVPASSCSLEFPTHTDSYDGTRPTLYIIP